jgi:hypothetical protein
MTLNSLEVTKCGKKQFILFSFLCLQNFLFFTFFIFRIIFARTSYATTVVEIHKTIMNLMIGVTLHSPHSWKHEHKEAIKE